MTSDGRNDLGVGLRYAEAKDEKSWRTLWERFVVGGPEPCGEEAPEAVWRGVLDPSSPLELLLAVNDADEPVGFALYVIHPWSWSARDACYLLDLFVDVQARGQRLGRRLLEGLAAIGKSRGWLKIYWMTQADNEAARRLYDKLAERSALVRYDLMLNRH